MENKILQEIYSIAKELNKSNDTFTRADLAYELKKFGIEKDSFRINELVWKAYCKFNNSKEIKNAFKNAYKEIDEELTLGNLKEIKKIIPEIIAATAEMAVIIVSLFFISVSPYLILVILTCYKRLYTHFIYLSIKMSE